MFTLVAVTPSSACWRICLNRFPLDGSVGSGPHLTLSSAAAWIASYSFGATTPRKLFFWSTFTPGMWATELASTDTICGLVPSPYAPWPSGRTTRPCSIPLTRMFWTYVYFPVTLAGMSTRPGPGATPTIVYCDTGFVPGAPGERPAPGDGTNTGFGRTSVAARPWLEP